MTQVASPTFLIVDDDDVFASIMARSLSRRGFRAEVAPDGESALQALAALPIDVVLLDLRLEHESGLQLIHELRRVRPELRVLIVTGYASIATAVEAVKRGAENYLPKPATADDVLRTLGLTASANGDPPIEERPLNPDRLKWEHIQRVLAENDGNVSATARALGMHRRTLQRILAKRPVHER